MRFLIDNQLPPALCAFLRDRGHDSSHVFELGMGSASDVEVWERAAREERVLVSKDEDFLVLALRPKDTGRLIWVRIGNCRNEALIEVFNRAISRLVAAFEGGQRVVEIHST